MGNVLLRQITLAIAVVLSSLLWLYWWIVIIAVLLTWVNPDPYNPIVRFLRSVTEPVFYRVRRAMPFVVVGRRCLGQLRVAHDGDQQIVEVVRDPPG